MWYSNGPATKLVAALEGCGCDASKNILKKRFPCKEISVGIRGDGWAYDIGFGGAGPHLSIWKRY